jgi:DNA-binding response OmpR family regulator
VLVVSAKSALADVELAMSMGAQGYLAKPFNAQVLLDEVRRLVTAVNGTS